MSPMLRFRRSFLWLGSAVLALASVRPAQAQEHTRKLIKKVEAQYPAELKRRAIGGTVRLRIYIKPDGTVRECQVLGGNPVLSDAAEKAVMQWRFASADTETTTEVAVLFNPEVQ